MSEEMEWQPVRIAPVSEWDKAHPGGKAKYDFEAAGKIVRVRPCEMPARLQAKFRRMGCNSERSFVIHDEDAKRLSIDRGGKTYACEHQIQAD